MKLKHIEIDFPVAVEFPTRFLNLIRRILEHITSYYENENEDRVMWPSEEGFKPIWENGELISFDKTTYIFRISERKK